MSKVNLVMSSINHGVGTICIMKFGVCRRQYAWCKEECAVWSLMFALCITKCVVCNLQGAACKQ